MVLRLCYVRVGNIIDCYQYSLVYGYSSESLCSADCIRMKRPLWEEKKVVMMEME